MIPMRTLLFSTILLSTLLVSCSKEKPAPAAEAVEFTAAKSADGAGARFTVRFDRKAADLAFAQVLIGKANPSSPPFCFVHYDASTTEFKLYKGPNALDFTEGAKAGTPSPAVQNDYCAVDAAQSSAADAGNELVLTVSVNFKAPMAGDQVVFKRSMEKGGSDSNWLRVGTWTVPGSGQ